MHPPRRVILLSARLRLLKFFYNVSLRQITLANIHTSNLLEAFLSITINIQVKRNISNTNILPSCTSMTHIFTVSATMRLYQWTINLFNHKCHNLMPTTTSCSWYNLDSFCFTDNSHQISIFSHLLLCMDNSQIICSISNNNNKSIAIQ